MAHASNRGTDGSGPIQAGTILADARVADFIPPFADLHEFRDRNLSSSAFAEQRPIAFCYDGNYNSTPLCPGRIADTETPLPPPPSSNLRRTLHFLTSP